jgi:hypothetical protein
MAEIDRVVIFGSASLLGKHPELGEQEDSPLLATYDADLIPFPFEEEIGLMLDEAFGEDRVFHQRFGYHADIVRPKVTETFPLGWEDRLSALPGVEGAFCLDPHDMAAAKCLIGRDKDRVQLKFLIGAGIIDPGLLRNRLADLHLPEATVAAAGRFLDELRD